VEFTLITLIFDLFLSPLKRSFGAGLFKSRESVLPESLIKDDTCGDR